MCADPEIVDEDNFPNVSDSYVPTIIIFDGITTSIGSVGASIIRENYRAEPRSKIRLIINSPGGEVHPALALIEIMKASLIPIETIAMGECSSAALMIFMAGTKGFRIVTKSCTLMSHVFSSEISGTYWNMKQHHSESDAMYDTILRLYVDSTGKSKKQIEKTLLSKIDTWISPEQAVQYGIADCVGTIEF